VKKNGHKSEVIFTEVHGGNVVPTGQKHLLLDSSGNEVQVKTKADVIHPTYGNITVKAPAGGKVQMLLQVTSEVAKKWGSSNPMYLASQAQREFYEDRHFNGGENEAELYNICKVEVQNLKEWLNNTNNFRLVLEYTLMNDTEIDYVADMYQTKNGESYMTPAKDFIDGIIALNPKAYVTESGLRVAVRVETGEFDKKGNKKTVTAFSFEVRSNADHCKSFLHKMEGGYIFPLIRKTVKSCVKI
jgi:hypothetical protein